jgi:hypothetical protein
MGLVNRDADRFRPWPLSFLFYAGDRDEPRHVHVERDAKVAKFWLDPIRLHRSQGFRRVELNRLETLIEQNRSKFVETWDDYFVH